MFCFSKVLSTLQLPQTPLRLCLGVGCCSQTHPNLGGGLCVYRMFVHHFKHTETCGAKKPPENAYVTLIVYVCSDFLMCIHYNIVWSRTLPAWWGKCLEVWCEGGRGYSKTDVSVKRREKQSLRFGKPNVSVPNFFMWAPLWRSSFLHELKIEAQVHHASLVRWFLPVMWWLLGICWRGLWGLRQLHPEASPSFLLPSISSDLAQAFFPHSCPALAVF